jgi:hypothetical protein
MGGETEARVEVRGGRLYVPAPTYRGTLAGCTAVALLVREGDWWLVPLAAGAGGLQLKQRTAGGDRVVEAQEFLRSQGVEDTAPATWLKLEHAAALGAFRLVRCAPG